MNCNRKKGLLIGFLTIASCQLAPNLVLAKSLELISDSRNVLSDAELVVALRRSLKFSQEAAFVAQ